MNAVKLGADVWSGLDSTTVWAKSGNSSSVPGAEVRSGTPAHHNVTDAMHMQEKHQRNVARIIDAVAKVGPFHAPLTRAAVRSSQQCAS